MKTIEYDRTGIVFADQDCEERACAFLNAHGDTHITVGTDDFITAVRVLICEGLIPNTEVQFLYKGDVILPDRDGRLPSWPYGFCDTSEGLLCRLLNGRFPKEK